MAQFDLYFPIEVNLEGSEYEHDIDDIGGCTRFGLLVEDLEEAHADLDNDGEFTCSDVMKIDRATAHWVLKKLYWDFFQADKIFDQKLAEFIVDAGLNQGRVLIAKYIQSIVEVTVDGRVGMKTIAAINAHSAGEAFHELYDLRKERYIERAKGTNQKKFLKGWLNRLDAIKMIS